MQFLKTQAHSFIIRVWYERTASTGHLGEWRGCFIDVASRDERYFSDIPKLGDTVLDALREVQTSLPTAESFASTGGTEEDEPVSADDDLTRKEPGV